MKLVALCAPIALAACGGAGPAARDPRDMPIEPPPPADAAHDDSDDLPFVPVGGAGSDEERRPDGKPTSTADSSVEAAACIPAGIYKVTVDLSGAKLSQVNTGMDDIAWCKSMLEGVPATTMATLEIKVANGQMRLEWPPGTPQTIVKIGACSIGVTSRPMISQLTFKNGRATGATSYSVGTTNHPDESCSAVGAKLTLVKQ